MYYFVSSWINTLIFMNEYPINKPHYVLWSHVLYYHKENFCYVVWFEYTIKTHFCYGYVHNTQQKIIFVVL